jgi:hypothetical protein
VPCWTKLSININVYQTKLFTWSDELPKYGQIAGAFVNRYQVVMSSASRRPTIIYNIDITPNRRAVCVYGTDYYKG